MNKKLTFLAVSLGMVFGVAQAGTIVIGGAPVPNQGQVTTFPTACTVNFNNGDATNICGVTYTGTNTSNFVRGSSTGNYATPPGDTSGYLAIGPFSNNSNNSITISLAGVPATPATAGTLGTKGGQANYFGFYTGSLDAYNKIDFFYMDALLNTFSGNELSKDAFGTDANGNQNQGVYVNYFTTVNGNQVFYDKVVLTSTQNSFETDNQSFGTAAIPTIPEPGSVALLGLAGLGLLFARRRKQN